MPPKVRLDALEDQKRDVRGAPQNEKTLKEIALEAVAEAKRAMPDGLPAMSPYKTLAQTEVINEAARYGFRLGNFVTEDELRLVTEWLSQRHAESKTPKVREAPPPVPMQAFTPIRLRGLKESHTNRWVAEVTPADKPKQVSVGRGQMAMIRNGKIIDANHYTRAVLQSFVDQGIKLRPIEELEPDEE